MNLIYFWSVFFSFWVVRHRHTRTKTHIDRQRHTWTDTDTNNTSLISVDARIIIVRCGRCPMCSGMWLKSTNMEGRWIITGRPSMTSATSVTFTTTTSPRSRHCQWMLSGCCPYCYNKTSLFPAPGNPRRTTAACHDIYQHSTEVNLFVICHQCINCHLRLPDDTVIVRSYILQYISAVWWLQIC